MRIAVGLLGGFALISLAAWAQEAAKTPTTPPTQLKGHESPIYAAAFTPNGELVATGSFDQTLKVWSTATGEELKTLSGHTNLVLSLAISPDGTALISGAQDNTIRLWDLPSETPLSNWEGHTEAVGTVAVSPDGTLVVSGGNDKSVRVWRRVDDKLIESLPTRSPLPRSEPTPNNGLPQTPTEPCASGRLHLSRSVRNPRQPTRSSRIPGRFADWPIILIVNHFSPSATMACCVRGSYRLSIREPSPSAHRRQKRRRKYRPLRSPHQAWWRLLRQRPTICW
jgi:hypothetical protein